MSNIKKYPAKKTAFSLIELSIVLVIIGILIAGIIGGISLLRGSTLRAAMSEARAYGTAANSFLTQYDYLPGDYKTAIGTSTFGDGDGVVEYVNSANNLEGLIAWQQLANSSMITPATYNVASPLTSASSATGAIVVSSVAANTYIPASKVKSSGWVFDRIPASGGTLTSTDSSFVILTGTIPTITGTSQSTGQVLVPTVGVGTTTAGSNAISVNDAIAIDNKIDDGYPLTGKVRPVYGTGNITASIGTTYCFDNSIVVNLITKGAYNVAAVGTVCSVGFQVSQ